MLGDLEEAIKHHQRAVSLTPEGHPDKSMYLNNLGNSLKRRFQRTGMLDDLEEAINAQQRGVLLTPDGHPNKPRYLSNLGSSFESRFGRIGILSNLDNAIKNQRQAVSLTPDDHPDKPMYLSNLGISLESRFGYAGMLSDLEEAVQYQQQGVLHTPDSRPNKPGYLNNLGNCLDSRFMRTRMLSNLEEAIKNKQRAVVLTPEGHPAKPRYFNNLGKSFESRFRCTKMLSDVEEAIKNHQQAVLLTPGDHPSKALYLGNLGNSFASRFGLTKIPTDLENAIENKQQAVLLTPDGHLEKPRYLYNLGISFASRFVHTESLNDMDQAISCFKSAAISNIGSPLLRARASRQWACLEAKRDFSSALDAYRRAIDLIPYVAWMGDPISTRHSQFNDLGDIPREAAAFALDAGHPDLALEWLEQGCSVVWNQVFSLRTPVGALSQMHPDICTEFTQTAHELRGAATGGYSIDPSNDVSITLEEETQRHHRLAEKWDFLVERIRSLPDFGDFLLPKRVSALKEAASSGAVVVINDHQRRCDALVLDRGQKEVLHIPLDKLRYDDVERMTKSLRDELVEQGYRGAALNRTAGGRSRLTGILSKLYSSIVYPILKGLDLITDPKSDSSTIPRIWWCPTGPLTFLPLHACCRGVGPKIDGTFCHVMSSYTPTITALLEARAVKQQPFTRLSGVVMANTPGEIPLPGAETEVMQIGELFPAHSGWTFEILRNEQATGERVLAHMQTSSWVHLACHAIQDGQQPTQSGFCLHDRRLTITDIITKPFAIADFAFLSACQTAAGDEEVLDEAIHITGAMLGAGYRSVIGTMWSIPDEIAPILAEKVYNILLSGGEPNSERAAQALHEALHEVRESDHDSFGSWVPFVHYGA